MVLCLWSFVPEALRMGQLDGVGREGFRELERSKYQPPAAVGTITGFPTPAPEQLFTSFQIALPHTMNTVLQS